jgi:exonuclease VII small subunit
MQSELEKKVKSLDGKILTIEKTVNSLKTAVDRLIKCVNTQAKTIQTNEDQVKKVVNSHARVLTEIQAATANLRNELDESSKRQKDN